MFTAVTADVWALVWGGIQLLLFDGGAFWAGVVFSALYLYVGRSERQKKP